MQEAAAARQQPEVVEGVACVHPVGCGAYKPNIPYIDCTPCGNRFKGFFLFFLFLRSAPRDSLVRTGRENVIHIVAAVSIIICAAAVEGIEESTAAAWLARARQSANS